MVIESVGHPELYKQALTFMRPGGRLLAFGLTDAQTEIAIKPLEIILKEQRIQGSVAGMGEDMHQALHLLSHQRLLPPLSANPSTRWRIFSRFSPPCSLIRST